MFKELTKKLSSKLLAALLLASSATYSFAKGDGVITIPSEHTVAATLDKLETTLESKGMNVFARVDHSGGAKKVGKSLEDTELLIFGNPKIGTPLMQCQRSIAIDLPQKMLAWQDDAGKVWLSYNDPLYLAKRHGLDINNPCYPILEKISKALSNFATQASK